MAEKCDNNRRRFFKIGASMILVTTSSSAAKVRFKRTSPASQDLVEVGLILGSGGHSTGIWGRLFNPPEGHIRRLGMLYTKVWCAKREVAEKFSKQFGAEVVDSFDGMVGKVDGMMIDDFNAVAYNYKLAAPYLEAGIPTFINRPFADSLQKTRDIVERSKKGGAPLMTASSYEQLKEVYTVRTTVVPEEITGYEAWNYPSDYYSHGIHGLWWAYACVGGGIHAVSLKTENWRKSNGTVTYVVHKDRGKGIGPFIGKIHEGEIQYTGHNPCAITIQPGDKTYIHHAAGAWTHDEFLWLPMLHRIQWVFETGGMDQTHDEIMEKCSMFIGAFYSHFEGAGKMVALDSVPEDWAIGSPYGYSTDDEIELYGKLFGKEKGAIKP